MGVDAYTTRIVDMATEGAALVALWIAGLEVLPEAARRKLELAHAANPAGISAGVGLMAGSDPALVGAQCLHFRRLHFGDQAHLGACLADFVVADSHRSAGPAMMVMRAALQAGEQREAVVYGFPNDKARAICSRAGLAQVGHLQRMGKVLRWRAVVQQGKAPRWTLVFAPLLDVGIRLTDVVTRLATRSVGLRSEMAALGDPRVDELWARRDRSTWMSERSAALLAWRYGYEDGGWRLLLVTSRGGALFGYATYHMQGALAVLGDFYCADQRRETTPLLLEVASRLRAQGASAVSLEVLASAEVLAAVRAAHFFRRGKPQPVYMRGLAGSPPAPTSLYMTTFDRDA